MLFYTDQTFDLIAHHYRLASKYIKHNIQNAGVESEAVEIKEGVIKATIEKEDRKQRRQRKTYEHLIRREEKKVEVNKEREEIVDYEREHQQERVDHSRVAYMGPY